jgi:hypothetical protein
MFEMPTPEGGEKGIVGAVVKSGPFISTPRTPRILPLRALACIFMARIIGSWL